MAEGVMSRVFEAYGQQYCELSADLYRRCSAVAQLNGELTKQSISEIKAKLEEAETLTKKMELEARTLEPDLMITLLANIREHRTDLKNHKNEVKKIAPTRTGQTARK